MTTPKPIEPQKRVAEQLNGRLAMLGIVACLGAYLTTGQIIPGFVYMPELSATNEISSFMAILWCFYPIGIVVFFSLLFSSDDDDDDEGGGVMTPVYQGA